MMDFVNLRWFGYGSLCGLFLVAVLLFVDWMIGG